MTAFQTGFQTGFQGIGAAAGTTVSPAAGALAFTGRAPVVTQSANRAASPAPGALNFTGRAPTVTRTANQSAAPQPGALTFAGHAPTVSQTSASAITPQRGTFAFTGRAPTVTQSANRQASPQAGALHFTGYAPTVFQSKPVAASPGVGHLTFTGHAPSVAQALVVDPRYARPLSDVSAGPWTPSTGTSLAAMIDEPSADSADYITTAAPGLCEIALNPVADPGTSSGQVVRYQAWSETGAGVTVRLMQGATIIAFWTHNSLPTAPAIFAQSLSAAQCDSITNYANLRFQFEAL